MSKRFRCRIQLQRAHVLGQLEDYVVKAVGESGGYGMLIGPQSTAEQRDEFRRRVEADPRNYIAQPTILLSRAPCFTGRKRAAAPRRPSSVYFVRRQNHHRARRPDARRSAKGIAGGEFVAGRRQQGHLGTALRTSCFLASPTVSSG